MKWQNAARDFLPATSRSVLISHKGVYQIAFYDKEKREFHVTDGEIKFVIPPNTDAYWCDIDVVSIQHKKDKSVLIVEDDHEDQRLLKKELLNCIPDIHVDSVNNGEQALSYLLKRGPNKYVKKLPDLILLDLNLPLIDGFGVLAEINKHDHLKQIPVFVISVSRSVDQWDRALNLGARCYFNKGSSTSDLRQVAYEICLAL